MMTPVPTFDELLDSAQESAVHLEMRDWYAAAGEQEDFALFRAGTWTLDNGRSMLADWLSLVERTVKRGVVVRRARVVSEPVTEYIKYEHALSPLNIEAGEQVRWLPRRRASDISLPGNDFWLIDGKAVLFNHFTGDGQISTPKTFTHEASVASLCGTAFEYVWERATPHDQYNV
ncbi:hypothetical protein OG436_14320 [Streptomyces caniferus]|nr:DUF6879 family protein [Streptomyces caniferus]